MQGMSDWNLHELENIAWDDFGSNDDHMVPHQGISQSTPCDSHNKPQHVENIGKALDRRGSASEAVFAGKEEAYCTLPMKDEGSIVLEDPQCHVSEVGVPLSCDPEFIVSASAFTSQDTVLSDECFNDCNVDPVSGIFCSNNAISGSGVSTDGPGSCYLPLDNVPTSTISCVDNGHRDSANDLAYYDLPDIGNFEDIDRMFSSTDAAFGQGHMGTADELSWFASSSSTLYGSEHAFESNLQSSYSELSSLNNISVNPDGSRNFLINNDTRTVGQSTVSSFYSQSSGDQLIANAEKSKDGNAPKMQLGIVKTSLHLKKLESQLSSEIIKMQQFGDQKLLSSSVCTQDGFSLPISKQKHVLRAPCSSSMQTPNHQVKMEHGLPPHQVPVTHTTLSITYEANPSQSYTISDSKMDRAPQCMQRLSDEIYNPPTVTTEKLKKIDHRHLHVPMTAEDGQRSACFIGKSSLPRRCTANQQKMGATNKVENTCLQPAMEIDSSILQESSCTTSVCPDDMSFELDSFQQLRVIADQLDVRTKLCIRDSLYRLARSAKERNCLIDTNSCTRASIDGRSLHSIKAPKSRCAVLMDPETDTNPIDRSVAHLLFTGLPEPTRRSVRRCNVA